MLITEIFQLKFLKTTPGQIIFMCQYSEVPASLYLPGGVQICNKCCAYIYVNWSLTQEQT